MPILYVIVFIPQKSVKNPNFFPPHLYPCCTKTTVGCGSRRQYFVFAPHQAFTFSFCILLLFYLHSHLAWELPRLPNKKCISNEMHFLFGSFLSSQARPQTRLSFLWKSRGFLSFMDLQPGTTRLCCAAKYFGVYKLNFRVRHGNGCILTAIATISEGCSFKTI